MTFVDQVARALVAAGRSVEIDAELSTIGVTSPTAAGGRVLAVVRSHARGVTLYAVHGDPVPAESLTAVTELCVRATADLLDASLELDLATGAVAARFPVVLGDTEPPEDALAGLLDAALDVVEETASRYADAIDDVIAGRADARSAAGAVRTAPVEELLAEVAEDPDRS